MNEKEKRVCMEKMGKAMSAAYSFDTNEKLTIVDMMVLTVLYLNPGITMTESIKKELFKDVPITTAQQSFGSFARMELLVKKPHPTDHKAKALFLTNKGEQLAAKVVGAFK